MGDLLLCDGKMASIPYYLEGISMNIYSLEELCYYIANNTYLLEKNFMNPELGIWIERELGKKELAEKLQHIYEQNGKLSAYIFEILKACGYCSPQEDREIFRVLSEMEEKTEFERNKIRADRLMERDKFLSSIYEYKRLLESKDISQVSALLKGDVWHNLGTAYARMFLFEEAADSFRTAYRFNERQESLKALIFVRICQGDEQDLKNTAREYHLDDAAIEALKKEVSLTYKGEEKAAFQEQLDRLDTLSREGKKKEYKQEVSEIIFSWKEEYRRISRV